MLINLKIIKGPQESFIENIRTNTSLLRKIVNNENLVIENIPVGNISKTKCGVCYMKNIANSDLVGEVKFRLSNLSIDSLLSTGQLEQLLEEEETFGLKDLKIDGLELTPEFKTDVYEYSAELKEDKTSLELTTIATEENAEIEVTGNEDLKDGENIITVIVKEKDTDKTATYQITVNKIKEKTNITEATVNNIDNKTKEMIILGIGILALIIVVIIIVIVNKKRNSNNGQEYYYSELYNNDESEENINEENQDEQEEYDEEIEEKKKKKHSKGKRFK